MKNLLIKDLKLLTHPTVFIFLLLPVMVMIPSYPYSVIFFYITLGLFFCCLNGRENNDIFYSLSLPIRKKDFVTARVVYFVLIQVAYLAITGVFVALKQTLMPVANEAGLDANLALLGSGLMLFGVFNVVFFINFFSKPDKVGVCFLLATIVYWLVLMIEEVAVFVVPFFKNVLDTPDSVNVSAKLLYVLGGAIVYCVLTYLGWKRGQKSFDKLDF